MKRKNHKWKEVEDGDGLEECIHCGSFRMKKANAIGILLVKNPSINGQWIIKYAKKGGSKWIDEAPECLIQRT